MNSFTAWLKKEFLEGARSYRFLILGVVMAFLAFMDPIMLKLLPLIMKSQAGFDLGSLVPATADFAFGSFLNDLFEIQSLVVCALLGGTMAKERKGRGFVIPFTKGADFSGVVAAKMATYAIYLALAAFTAALASYLYASVVFPGGKMDLAAPILAGAHYSLYFAFLVALTAFVSALSPSGIAATLISAAAVYGMAALGGVFRVERYLPTFLALGSKELAALSRANFLPSELSAAGAIVLCFWGAVAAMKKAEL